ncbi:hypothetical protein HPP92_008371 [Vanilla planifolia]|uniref:U1-type domain-containing protein n=1 Tax=Vanilla planifolia TaxID=51239 RepID=A0A835R4Y8_VANPL|nr:hypothetical protein HPP92_008568 [Vanilla planifolia]KAG0486276.1 hypothetical protein HPP92_008371 [Vanilla planifolia]
MMPTLAQQHYSYPIMIHLRAPIRPGVRGVLPCIRGSRRGGVAYRDRGLSRSHMGQLPYARNVGPSPYRGRLRGHMNRGHGRGFHHSAPETERHQTTVSTTSVPPIPAAAEEVRGPLSAPKPQERPLLVAWCDLCRVDCNTKEILEQHKNGKRHKRTLQRVQELQAQQMTIVGLQLSSSPPHSIYLPEVHKDTVAADGVEAGDLIKKDAIPPEQEPPMDEPCKGSVAPENTSTNQDLGTIGDALQEETMQMQSVGKKRRMHGNNDRWRGAKRKMDRVGRGGKHVNGFDRPKAQPFGRSKERLRDRPRVCTVCSVTCDTLAVFECHLSGKKHLSRIKRFEGQGSVYGPISVYIPPNQPMPNPIKGPEPVFYGMQTNGALQRNEENHVVAVEDKEKVPGPEVNLEVNQGSEAGEAANAEVAVAVTAEDVALPSGGDSTAGILHGSDGDAGELACMEAGSQLNQSF